MAFILLTNWQVLKEQFNQEVNSVYKNAKEISLELSAILENKSKCLEAEQIKISTKDKTGKDTFENVPSHIFIPYFKNYREGECIFEFVEYKDFFFYYEYTGTVK